jgi:hypothetical protein
MTTTFRENQRVPYVLVYVASAAYIFRVDGEMREQHLDCEFLANSPSLAVRHAAIWARDREKVLAEIDGRELSSLKVYTKRIGRLAKDKRFGTRTMMCLFEWKCDFPGTLDQTIESEIELAKTERSRMKRLIQRKHLVFHSP